jgi:hypothetical protein
MKLLLPQQHKQTKEKEDAIKRIRTAEITKEYEDKLRLLNILNADFEKALEVQKDTYADEKDTHALWRADAEAEVRMLETRKANALLPIEKRESEVSIKEEELREGQESLKKAQADFEDEKELMYKRLAEVGERETEVKHLQDSLVSQKRGNDTQAESIKQQSKQLSKTLEELAKDSAKRELDYSKRKTILDARDEALASKDKRLSTLEQDLVNRERALTDKYQTLERTIKRLKK